MNYKLITNTEDVVLGITENNDIMWIPNALGNKDWAQYLEWLADGNEPQAADSE